MATQITVRGVSEELAERLKKLARERGNSLNGIVLQLLEDAVGVDAKRARLARYTTWTKQDFDDFQKALGAQRVIDQELWR